MMQNYIDCICWTVLNCLSYSEGFSDTQGLFSDGCLKLRQILLFVSNERIKLSKAYFHFFKIWAKGLGEKTVKKETLSPLSDEFVTKYPGDH